MHIGFDAKRAFSNNTGLGNYSRTLIRALADRFPESRYSLYTPDRGSIFTPPQNSTLKTPDSLPGRLFKSYWRSYGIGRQIANDGVDIFHGLSNEIPFSVPGKTTRSVVTIHDLIFLKRPELYPFIDRRIYLRKARYAVQNADRIIAVSRQTGEDLVELLGAEEAKLRIIPQGCNPWFYTPVTDDVKKSITAKYNLPEQYLLYVGTIEERKNLLIIIRALHEFGIDIPLVAIGRKTQYFRQIKQFMEDHGVSNVHFLEGIINQDLPVLYQNAGMFIYPSSYEGFGIPVLEALNSGIPVITSRGGCLEETAGKGALLVEPGNVEQLAHAIRSILDDRELRNKLVENGMAHAMNFREENTIPRIHELYRELL